MSNSFSQNFVKFIDLWFMYCSFLFCVHGFLCEDRCVSICVCFLCFFFSFILLDFSYSSLLLLVFIIIIILDSYFLMREKKAWS